MSTQSPASAGPSGDNHPKATRKEATGDHAALIRYFLYKWKAKYPQGDYTFLPKDGAAAEKILKRAAHGNLDRAKHIVDEFFACEDPWISERLPLAS